MKHVKPASSKEHWESKKYDCPCADYIYRFRSGGWICKATPDKECTFENCPFYYWVFYVKKQEDE